MSNVQRARRGLKKRLKTAAATLTAPHRSATLSVIVVARGKAEFLDACLSSVLASTHDEVDVILVAAHDDRDAQLAIRDRSVTDNRLRALEGSTSRSDLDRAVDQADGAYVAFVDADDTVPPGGYEHLLAVLDETRSDFAVGQQFRQESGTFREVPWSAGLLAGRRLRAKASDVPEAIVDSGHGNRVLSTEFWRHAGLRFDDAGLRSAPSVMTAAFLRCGTFDIVPERAYDECVRDRSRPLAEQRRYQSTDLGARLRALRASAAMVETQLSSDAYESWLVTVLDRVVPPLYVDSVVADAEFFGLLSEGVRALIESAPPGLLGSVPIQSRISAWIAANSDSADLSQMADFLADNPHGLPISPVGTSSPAGHQVVIPSAVKAEVPGWVREVLPVDLEPRTRLTRLAISGGTVEIYGAAFFKYGQDALPRVELVNAETGLRRSTRTVARRDPGINRWAGRAWEDHSQAGFTATVDVDDLRAGPPEDPSSWRVDATLSELGLQSSLPMQTRDPGVLETTQTYLVERGLVSARWESARGLVLTLDPSPDDPRRPRTEDSVRLVVDEATMTGEGLRVSGRSQRSGRTRWRLVGSRGAGMPTESRAEGGRFTATLNLTRTEWGREGTPLRTGRYRVEVSGADGSDLPLQWTDQATGVRTDLIAKRLRVEVHAHAGRADLALLPPVPSHARGIYAQNQLRTAGYVSARERERADAVLFESFRGVSVGDNPGAICAEMLRRRLDLDLDLAWVVDDTSVIVPAGTRAVARRSPEWYGLLATARGYVSNAAAPYFFRKRGDQFHMQTWHGTPLKRIGEDRPADGFDMWRHDRHMRSQSSNWDALVSPSPYCSDRFRSAFHYDGTMLEAGYPRNDVLLSEDSASRRARVRAALGVGQLGLDQPERVLLYAPTWRDYAGARESKPLYLDAELVTASSSDTVILVRGHYNGTSDADAYPGKPRILDVTRYPDIADLYLAADVLVTDYSSVMFDFALTDKPMILLVPDLERYRDVERGFYFDIEDQTPGPMLTSTEEVIEALDEPDGFASVRDRFRRTFCPFDDGQASARVVDHLLARW